MLKKLYALVLLAAAVAFPNAVYSQSIKVSATIENLPFVNGSSQLFVKSIDARLGQAWAVGYYRITVGNATQTRSLAYRYLDGAWSIVQTPSPPSNAGTVNVQLDDVKFGVDNQNAVAAGFYVANGFNAPDTFMLDYDGSSWNHIVTPGQSTFGAQGFLFEAVHVGADGETYLGGQFTNPTAGRPTATLVVRQGNSFDRYDGELISNSAHRFRDLDSTDTSKLWAVGAAGGSSTAIGRVYAATFDGNSLTENSPPNISFGENLRAVAVVDDDDVWASGVYKEVLDDGSVVSIPLFWHWNGSSWIRFESPAFAQSLVANAADDIFGVSNDKLVHWDGKSWTVVHEFGEAMMSLRSVAISNSAEAKRVGVNELIAVGENTFASEPIVVTYTIVR